MFSSELVSVIVPVFNVESYLAEAIESVLYQTCENLEIIVVDDGSTDGSGEICDRFATTDSRIRVVHQEHRGLSSARNAGLDLAIGHYIAFLDADDAYCPNMIQFLLHEIKKQNADIAICGCSLHNTQGRMKTEHLKGDGSHCIVIEKPEAFQKIWDGSINTAVWDKIYRSRIWENLRFPDGYVYEGTHIVFDIFDRAERVAITDEKLVMHRNRPGSICNTCSLKNIQDAQHAMKQYIEFIKSHTPEYFLPEQLDRVIEKRLRSMIGLYMLYAHKNPEDMHGRQHIKAMLLKVADKVDLQHCALTTRIGYLLVLFSPRLSWFLFQPYRMLKCIIHN